jgi:potassium channel subfamily K
LNLILFGILTRNSPGYSFLEGFWCAVVSLIASALVAFALVAHMILEWRRAKQDGAKEQHIHRQVRVAGRHFMLSTTLFLALDALTALVLSRVEGWSYLQGIYFGVVTFETIGYGDLEPTHPATYILVFPLALLGIAQLGALVQQIVSFFSARSARRKEMSRAKYERERQEQEDSKQDPADLAEEMEFLENINSRQDLVDQAIEFGLVRIRSRVPHMRYLTTPPGPWGLSHLLGRWWPDFHGARGKRSVCRPVQC